MIVLLVKARLILAGIPIGDAGSAGRACHNYELQIRGPHRLLNEFPLTSAGPWIICQAEPNSFGNWGMVVEPEDIHAIRIRIR